MHVSNCQCFHVFISLSQSLNMHLKQATNHLSEIRCNLLVSMLVIFGGAKRRSPAVCHKTRNWKQILPKCFFPIIFIEKKKKKRCSNTTPRNSTIKYTTRQPCLPRSALAACVTYLTLLNKTAQTLVYWTNCVVFELRNTTFKLNIYKFSSLDLLLNIKRVSLLSWVR